MTILKLIAAGWGAWALLNLIVFMLSVLILRPTQPHFNGFQIIIPVSLVNELTPAELAAVVAHEQGHQNHGHVWANLMLACCFRPVSEARRRKLEYQADDFAACCGHAEALASAIEKLSPHWFDRERALRLRLLYT